jgi:hypothetical protein
MAQLRQWLENVFDPWPGGITDLASRAPMG